MFVTAIPEGLNGEVPSVLADSSLSSPIPASLLSPESKYTPVADILNSRNVEKHFSALVEPVHVQTQFLGIDVPDIVYRLDSSIQADIFAICDQ